MPTSLPQRRRRSFELAPLMLWDEIDAFFLVLLPLIACLIGIFIAADPVHRGRFIEASQAIACADAGMQCDDLTSTPPAGTTRIRSARWLVRPHVTAHLHAIAG